MPLGPGAEESEAVLRVEAISLGVISVQVLVGVGGGSFSYMVCTSGGFSGKNCCWKICALWVGLSTSMLSMSRRGGKVLVGRPFRTLASDQIS
jgi:hypothetical protein